jgi:hypothetical protein
MQQNSNQKFLYLNRSIISIFLTGLLTAINHYGELNILAFIIFPLLFIILPIGLLEIYKRNENKNAYKGFLVVTIFMIVGAGILRGFFLNTFKVLATYVLSPLAKLHGGVFSVNMSPIDPFYDGTGVLLFLSSMVLAYYIYRAVNSAELGDLAI